MSSNNPLHIRNAMSDKKIIPLFFLKRLNKDVFKNANKLQNALLCLNYVNIMLCFFCGLLKLKTFLIWSLSCNFPLHGPCNGWQGTP